MTNITPVSTFTAPVTTLQNGDPVDNTSTDPTSQALTNRTEWLKDVVQGDANKNIAKTATVANTCPITGTGNGTGAGGTFVGGSSNGTGVAASASGTGKAITATAVNGVAISATTSGLTQNAIIGTASGTAGVGVAGSLASSASDQPSQNIGAGVQGLSALDGSGHALVARNFVNPPVNAPFFIVPSSAPTGWTPIGAMYVTSAGVLKICTVAGVGASPGTFVSVGAQT